MCKTAKKVLGAVTFGLLDGEKPKKYTIAAPQGSSPEVQEAMERERRLAMLRRGRASTILSSQSGSNKTLLGE